MKSRLLAAAALTVLAVSSSAALAADVAPTLEPGPFFSEFRLGGFAHALGSPERGGLDLNAELLFTKPFDVGGWAQVLVPQPHVGTTLNFDGKTSTVYAGGTWHFSLFESPFFGEVTAGASVNNGQLDDRHNNMNPLGCHVLLRESAALGYDIDRHWSVMGTFEHNSNANLCDQNRGLSNAGLRIGYKF